VAGGRLGSTERSAGEADRRGARQGSPAARQESPAARQESPAARPDRPAARGNPSRLSCRCLSRGGWGGEWGTGEKFGNGLLYICGGICS
jgi:hypothetical protein